jgi:tetratricopeptide (TPR) repeat protein
MKTFSPRLQASLARPLLLPAVGGLLAAPALAAESASAVASAGAPGILTALLVALLVSAVIVKALILWSHKQEHRQEMMLFCMKYLVHSSTDADRADSARALGRARDPGALLTLANLTWNEEEPPIVRQAAGEALDEMARRVGKYARLIPELKSAADQKDFRRIIELITANFEQGAHKHVQSAYILGRHCMRLARYADARDWFERAESRNRKFNLYGNRIRRRIVECNALLLDEADSMFETADYQGARQHYAALSRGLSAADRRQWAVYLRSACVYCKLLDYRDADAALQQAIEHQQQTDLALTLKPLLAAALERGDATGSPAGDSAGPIERAIDERASAIMEALRGPKRAARHA